MATMAQAIAEAIAAMEGYYTPGTIASRNKNPGNLRGGPRQIGVDARGYGLYADDSAGWADLVAQVERNIGRGLNLYEFFGGKPGVYAGYAPAADSNDPHHYADFVASRVGVDPSQVLMGSNTQAATTPGSAVTLSLPLPFEFPVVGPGAGVSWAAVAAVIGIGVLVFFTLE